MWEARSGTSGNYYVIIHCKATDWVTWPSVYSATYYEEQQQPSVTGLHDDSAELLFRTVTQNHIYKMHYDGTYWGSPVYIGSGENPSLSTGHTNAKYVWTFGSSAPDQILISTETLSKTSGSLSTAYHRSIAVIDTTTGNWLEVRLDKLAVKTKAGEEFAIPFAEAKADTNTLTPANAFVNLASSPAALPVDAESLLVHCRVNGQGLSTIKSHANMVNVEIALSPKNGTTVKLPIVNTSSENLPETEREIAIAASIFAGKEINLRAQVTGIDNNKSTLIASLGHIYEVVEAPTAKIVGGIGENIAPQGYALSVHPNPFNPSTQIRFAMKEAGIATLRVNNLNGQLIRELLNEHRAAGIYNILWDGRNDRGTGVASGVYFIRFEAANAVKVSKALLVR